MEQRAMSDQRLASFHPGDMEARGGRSETALVLPSRSTSVGRPEEKSLTDYAQMVREDSYRAHQLQSMLLPKRGLCLAAWETYYDYSPAGAVGGDYCDLVAVD